MLVLDRKPGQQIVVDTPRGVLVLTVISVRRGRAKLGFEAPQSMRIYRIELDDKTKPSDTQ